MPSPVITLPADSQGFLTGDRIAEDELISQWQGISDRLDDISGTVEDIAALLRKNGLQPQTRAQQAPRAETGGNSRRRDAGESRPAVPRRRREPAGEEKPETGRTRRAAARRETPIAVPAPVPAPAVPVGAESTGGNSPAPKAPSAIEPQKTEKPARRTRTHAAEPPATPRRRTRTETTDVGSKSNTKVAAVKPEADKAKTQAQQAPRAETGWNALGQRDAKGRFIGSGSGDNTSKGLSDETVMGRFAEKVGQAVSEAGESVGEADPAVQAMQEATAPFARGFELFKDFKRSKEEGLLSRILSSLRGMRKESSTYQKAAEKRLKAIEEKPVAAPGEGSGGIFPSLGSIKAGLPALLAAFAKKLPAIGSILAVGRGAFDIFNSESSDTLSRREKNQRTGSAVGRTLGAVGGLVGGAKAGALLGSALGPVGTAIGGIVGASAGAFFASDAGAIVGEKIGSWTSDMTGIVSGAWNNVEQFFSNTAASISSAWDNTTATFSATWSVCTEGIQSAWTGATQLFTGEWSESIKSFSALWDKTTSSLSDIWKDMTEGFEKDGIVGGIKAGVKSVGEGISSAWDSAKKSFAGAVEERKGVILDQRRASREVEADARRKGVTLGAGTGIDPDRLPSIQQAGSWRIGQTSERFESGGRGAGTISSGRGDLGGASYGTYQLSSNTGTLDRFLEDSGYGDKIESRARSMYEGLNKGGSYDNLNERFRKHYFDMAWRQQAAADPAFAEAQHDFVKRTHYDPAMKVLQSRGIDLSKRGRAVQDALWSTSVQFGAGSIRKRNGAAGLVEKALAGEDVSKLSDEDIVTKIQDYKIRNNNLLFARSSDSVRKGTLARAYKEKESLLALAAEDKKLKGEKEAVGLPGLLRTEKPKAAPVLAKHREQTKPIPMPEFTKVPTLGVDADGNLVTEKERSKAFGKRLQEIAEFQANPLANMRDTQTAANAPVVTAAAPPVAPPVAAPQVPAPAPAAAVPAPLNTNSRPPVVAVKVEEDAKQDVRDRGIAHIVTGGIA